MPKPDIRAERSRVDPNLPPEVLTSIRGLYTLATPHEAIPGDVDEVAVRHFLDTLAEVALAVASRKARR